MSLRDRQGDPLYSCYDDSVINICEHIATNLFLQYDIREPRKRGTGTLKAFGHAYEIVHDEGCYEAGLSLVFLLHSLRSIQGVT